MALEADIFVVRAFSTALIVAERDSDPVPCVGESQFTVQGTVRNWLALN